MTSWHYARQPWIPSGTSKNSFQNSENNQPTNNLSDVILAPRLHSSIIFFSFVLSYQPAYSLKANKKKQRLTTTLSSLSRRRTTTNSTHWRKLRVKLTQTHFNVFYNSSEVITWCNNCEKRGRAGRKYGAKGILNHSQRRQKTWLIPKNQYETLNLQKWK